MATRDVWTLLRVLRNEALREDEIAKAPPPVREGRVFAHVLRHLPIGISDDAILAGEFGWAWCSPAEAARWDAPADGRQSTGRGPSAEAKPSPLQLMSDWFHCRVSDGGRAHTTVDYGVVVREGLAGRLARIESEMGGASQAKREYLRGMQAAIRGMVDWAERYADLARQLADSASNEADRQRLLGISERCRHVPQHPARSFKEATQSIWFIHLGIAISEHSGASLSLGRLDQYLHPLFLHDLEQGVSETELEEDLADFFRVLNTMGDPACTVNLFPDMAVNVGGGDESFNQLSRMVLRVVKRLRLPAPLLAARVHQSIPDETFDLFTDPALLEMGQPTFYGEEACRCTLLRRGVPEDEVGKWAANSCMGLMMPAEEWSNMWGSVINILLPLELALNKGQPFLTDMPLPLTTRPADRYQTFDQLLDAVAAYMSELVDIHIRETAERTERRGREQPNPFVSALLSDCIERGKDRLLGGCRYHTVIVEAFGLVNASDALLSIRQLVFGEGRCSLEEMTEAARTNFEKLPDILHAIRGVPKYGNGDAEADEMARRLADRFARAVARHSGNGVCYAPSFHTLAAHIPAGKRMAASLDGRLAGDPLAKNIGTSPGRCTEGHTALMRSAATIDQTAFCGGQALDISLDLNLLRTTSGRRKFQALLKTYFKLGGLQVQVNAVSPDMLRAAMADPASHRDVLVRKAGFTTRYVTLPPDEQRELIERFEAGL